MSVYNCWTRFLKQTRGFAQPISHWGEQGEEKGNTVGVQVRSVNGAEWSKVKGVTQCFPKVNHCCFSCVLPENISCVRIHVHIYAFSLYSILYLYIWLYICISSFHKDGTPYTWLSWHFHVTSLNRFGNILWSAYTPNTQWFLMFLTLQNTLPWKLIHTTHTFTQSVNSLQWILLVQRVYAM